MPVLLFKLKHVPEDEAEEVRQLLQNHHIAFYETPPGRWGVSVHGIWLTDNSQLDQARVLLQEYQIERRQRMRRRYAELRASGELPSFADRIRREPIKFILLILFVLFIIYLSVYPFLQFAWSRDG